MIHSNSGFLEQVASPRFCERLFAHLPDVVFCLKDNQRRYQAANPAFSIRLGFHDPSLLLGKTAEDFFPDHLAESYRTQDQQVLDTGREMIERLELVTNQDGSLGWYLATKIPLHNPAGEVIGISSISRDLRTPDIENIELPGLQRVARHIRKHKGENLLLPELAKIAGLSPTQLDRRMRRIFHLSTSGFIRKTRIGHAAQLLATTSQPIVDIALSCGYGDQTAFTRQFRRTVGLPPAAYREREKSNV